jgi:hypothetical protein
MPSALIALDEQLYVTQWNQEASALSGTRLDEALNQPVVPGLPAAEALPATDSRTQLSSTSGRSGLNGSPGLRDDDARHYALDLLPA